MTDDARKECPKCGAEKSATTEACVRCGLVFANWTPELAAALPRLDEQATTEWQALQADWQNEAAHDAFLKYCSLAGVLGPAGRAYREYARDHVGDPVAAKMQERILAMAGALLGPVSRRPEQGSILRGKTFWIIVMLGAIFGTMGGIAFRGC